MGEGQGGGLNPLLSGIKAFEGLIPRMLAPPLTRQVGVACTQDFFWVRRIVDHFFIINLEDWIQDKCLLRKKFGSRGKNAIIPIIISQDSRGRLYFFQTCSRYTGPLL
jgi:hypothetical protein